MALNVRGKECASDGAGGHGMGRLLTIWWCMMVHDGAWWCDAWWRDACWRLRVLEGDAMSGWWRMRVEGAWGQFQVCTRSYVLEHLKRPEPSPCHITTCAFLVPHHHMCFFCATSPHVLFSCHITTCAFYAMRQGHLKSLGEVNPQNRSVTKGG